MNQRANASPFLTGLTLNEMREHPLAQLEFWLQQAVDSGLTYPTAMILATTDHSGKPDQRTVLLKHCDEKGLIFFSEDTSKKTREIQSNPYVSVHFPWHELDRQVRIGGRVHKLSTSESTRYFITPPDYQRYAPDTSDKPFSCRQFLIEQFATMRSKFYGGGERTPRQWGGYRIMPECFEFWQGGGPRLRDRFVYRLSSQGHWEILQLVD